MYSFDKYDFMAEEEMKNEEIEKEMQNYKKKSLRRFELIALHPEFTHHVAASMIYAFRESCPNAQIIIEKLDLTEMEILSLQEDFPSFKSAYMKDLEDKNIEEWAV